MTATSFTIQGHRHLILERHELGPKAPIQAHFFLSFAPFFSILNFFFFSAQIHRLYRDNTRTSRLKAQIEGRGCI
ncbi:hypothetical protein NC651_002470 [Populus alba x Populus x berolinensis]|nr:hypothetical protein NC651_002470 [Populus alba x Populus x berolinensis]